MLTYDLEQRGSMPLYDFLYRSIKKDILQGRLKPGEKMPSKRGLAGHLKISVITVAHAYEQLVVEGYLVTQVRRGYFVGDVAEEINFEEPFILDGEKEEKPASLLCDFTKGNIGQEQFPFSLWAKLMREVLTDRNPGLLQAPPYNGVYELRKAIRDYLFHFHGMKVACSCIFIGAGTEYLYTLLIQLLGRDKIFAVENPGYRQIAEVYQGNGGTVVPVDLDEQGLDVEKLRNSGGEIAHISPSHHFPTGIVMPIGRRQELLRWAGEAEGRLIIEDDYDSEFRYQGKPIPPLYSIDKQGKVIYMNTFSKTMAPSLRISYMVLPEELAGEFHRKLGFYACTVPTFEQYALAKFISLGYFERHIRRLKNYYRTRREEIIVLVKNSALGKKGEIIRENAGLQLLLRLNTKLSDEELIAKGESQGIRLRCVSSYYYGDNHDSNHIVILNYSDIDDESLKKALAILGDIL